MFACLEVNNVVRAMPGIKKKRNKKENLNKKASIYLIAQ